MSFFDEKSNMALSSCLEVRDNNFNFIRFVAAVMVLIAHGFVLISGLHKNEPFVEPLNFSIGSLAVNIFFCISGFLILNSFLNKKNIFEFIVSRVLRIFPGLLVVVFISVFFLGPVVSSKSLLEYFFEDFSSFHYWVKNSTLLFGVAHELPGVFLNNPYPNAVNGSLWTLPYEVWMYVLCIFLGYLYIYLSSIEKKYAEVFMLCFILFLFSSWMVSDGKTFRLLFSFFIGAAFLVFADNIFIGLKYFGISVLLFLCGFLGLIYFKMEQFLFYFISIFLPYFIFSFAYLIKGFVLKFNNFGDYSYGMYIYAFPVQQILVFYFPYLRISVSIIICFLITMFFSILSWHFIEKKAMGRKKILSNYLSALFNKPLC